MKLYKFIRPQSEQIIEEVRAENHIEAVQKAISPMINTSTDFYTEELDIRDDEFFRELATDAMLEIGLTEDESERMLEDLL